MPTRRFFIAGCLIAGFAGCNPTFNWREVRSPDGYSVSLPGRAQTVTRDVTLQEVAVPMSMTSTGIDATLFAVGVARLPYAGGSLDRHQALAVFRDALVRNIDGRLTHAGAAPLPVPSGDSRTLLASEAIEARGRDTSGRAVRLAARFYIVDDRLFQVVALSAEGENLAEAFDTFFTSFRLN